MLHVRTNVLRTTATSLRAALTAASLTVLVGLGALSVLAAPQPPAQKLGLSVENQVPARLMERNHCSTTGFDSDVIPASAVIRDEAGRAKLVSFERGWAVFKDERPGELVAVCLGRPRAGGG